MSVRSVFALFVLVGATAFAPAPFPRADRTRVREDVSIRGFQGMWRVTSMEGTRQGGQRYKHNWFITHIRVRDDRWTFMQGKGENASYRLVIDGSKRPAKIDFYSDADRRAPGTRTSMIGIMKRQGNRVQILYVSGGRDPRPTNFENSPSGWWLLSLEKEQ